MRSGDQLRAVAQLVETPGGTLVTSHTVQAPLGDLFQLQDDIAQRVVDALALPLGGRSDTPTPQQPHNARAYALYLQANQHARSYGGLQKARELYQQSLDLDPSFAPAWAQIGRCHRVIGKFIDGSDDSDARAEQALRKALELNPHLTLAHKYYAHLEAETGQPRAALVRLVGEAKRHGNDPELFAGLVHAGRYCGLFEQAIAAHEEARRLDPNVPSSIEQTVLMTGDVDRLLALPRIASATGSDSVIDVIGLGLAGRRDQAMSALAEHRRQAQLDIFHAYADTLLAWLERRPADMRTNVAALEGLKIMNDPEAMFQEGWLLCDVGEHAEGMKFLRRAIDKGYTVATTLAERPPSTRSAATPCSSSSWPMPSPARSRRSRTSARAAASGCSGADPAKPQAPNWRRWWSVCRYPQRSHAAWLIGPKTGCGSVRLRVSAIISRISSSTSARSAAKSVGGVAITPSWSSSGDVVMPGGQRSGA